MKAVENIFLVGHPLSIEFRRRVAERLNLNPDLMISMVELRALKPWALCRRLLSLRCRNLYLCLEEPTLVMILPLLELLSLGIRSENTYLVSHDLTVRALSRTQRLKAFFAFLTTCLMAFRDVVVCDMRARWLLKSDRVRARLSPSASSVLYLKTNLMIGAKAGGSVGHVAGVINGFQDEGYPVAVVCAERPVHLRPAVTWEPLPLPGGYGLPFDVNYYAYHRQFVRGLHRRKSGSPRFLYQRMSVGNFAGVELSRDLKVPLVLEYNGSEVWIINNWGSRLFFSSQAQRAEDVALKHAHLVVTVSEVLRDELAAKGIAPERIVTYPNCVDPTFFSPGRFGKEEKTRLRKQWGIAEHATVVTFVGTFGLWHGTEIFAESIRQWVTQNPTEIEKWNMHFLWVGDGLKKAEIERSLKGVADERIHFTGLIAQDQTPLYLDISDILVSPHVPNSDGSRFFGSPTKLFEYMAMGKAIIASDLEQIGDILAPGLSVSHCGKSFDAARDEVAVLCRPGSASDLVTGMRYFAESAERRSAFGARAARKALDRFTWTHHVRAILDGLERIEGLEQ